MKHTKPFILLPAAAHNGHTPQTYGLNQVYIDAIVRAGGNPLMIARPDNGSLGELLEFVDGIFLAGGHDVDPKEYGEEKKAYTCDVDQERDRVELALVCLAQEKNIPLFGVCRGLQVMNVALGGSLYQDVYKEMPGAQVHDFHYDDEQKPLARSLPKHEIVLSGSSTLAAIIGTGRFEVNSLHHQGIKKLGTGLRAAGTSPDGLIEAAEAANRNFCIGVQWHPEELGGETSAKLFAAFVAACKAAKNTPNDGSELGTIPQGA